MIVQEVMGDLVKTYSDIGMMIRGGFPEGLYAEAIDPISAGRIYEETDIPIDEDEDPESILHQKADAYDILMGNELTEEEEPVEEESEND